MVLGAGVGDNKFGVPKTRLFVVGVVGGDANDDYSLLSCRGSLSGWGKFDSDVGEVGVGGVENA